MIKAIILDCFGVLYDPRQNLPYNGELLEYSQELRKKYKVGVLSNMSEGGMDSIFDPAEQKQLFDAVVVSGAVGVMKPDPEIYKIICEKLGIEPNEAVMIDDREVHCEGAKQAGLQAILYKNIGQCRADLERTVQK